MDSMGVARDEKLVEDLRASLAAIPDVSFAYLFGSQARGDASSRSDVDVAVGLVDGVEADVLALMAAIEGVGRRHLDLIVLNTAPPFIAYEALHGLLLFQKDEELRVMMETRISREYLDREPAMRRDLEHTLRRFAAEGFG